jgi:hypothetical protein
MFSHVSNILNAFLQFHFPAFIFFYPLFLHVWQTDFTQYIFSHLASLPYRRITITAISQNLSHHHSQYQFHKKLGGLQRISGHATEEKNVVAPVWYQSSQSTTHNLTPHTKVHKQSQSHPVHNFMHRISNHLYCLTVSVSCNNGVFSSELITKTMHLSFHLCYKSYVSQTEVEHFFRSGNHTHICFKKTFLWLSPMLNIHLLPSVVLRALNNRPDIQKCQKNLIWKESFIFMTT